MKHQKGSFVSLLLGGAAVVVSTAAFANVHSGGFVESNGVYTKILGDPTAVNNSGAVAGYGYSGSVGGGFIYSGGIYTNVSPPGSTSTRVTSINNAGVVAGYYFDSSDQISGFIDSGGIYTTVNPPHSSQTYITGINSAGVVAGTYYVGSYSDGYTNMGFIDSDGIYTTLSPPGGADITGINDAGAVAGNFTDDNDPYSGFIYSGGTYTPVYVPGSRYTIITTGISDTGAVAGYSSFDTGGFIYSGGTYTNVSPPGLYFGGLTGVNDAGAVVGIYYSGFDAFGFIDVGGTYTTLNVGNSTNIIGAKVSTSYIHTYPAAINNAGVVAGSYEYYSVPEPATWAMMLVGFGAVGFALRRKIPSRSGHAIKVHGDQPQANVFVLTKTACRRQPCPIPS